jgi:hypothetical protein
VLDNQVDPTTGTIKLKATFPNPENRLWPGAFVGVEVQVDTAKDAVVVPPAAVQRGPRGAYVYVANADGSTARRDVKVGHEDAGQSIIAEGVRAGEKVVIDGTSRLNDGSKVTIVQPAAAAVHRRRSGHRRRNAAAAGRGAGVIMRSPPREAGILSPLPLREGLGRGPVISDEHLGPVHRPPDRHLAAGDCDPAGRRAWLSRAAHLRPA